MLSNRYDGAYDLFNCTYDFFIVYNSMNDLKADQEFLTNITGIKAEFFYNYPRKEQKNFTIIFVGFQTINYILLNYFNI